MSKLYLLGAGPGDPELITIKAVRILREADVVLYDALASEHLLTYCKEGAILEFVGKRYGVESAAQEDINSKIINYAKHYETIVRLKGGDPGVFGRACEEKMDALRSGIEVEVVPGISSALAVPVLNDIPLTSRGVSESFWVTTGTTKDGSISHDLHLAAQSTATVIVLMAMSKLEKIMEIFIQYNKALTPVAIIQNGTLPNQKMIEGVVSTIVKQAEEAQMGNPAIIVIGEVVNKKCELKSAIDSYTNSNK